MGKEKLFTFDAVTWGTAAATTVRHCARRVPKREEVRSGLLAKIIVVHSCMRPGDVDCVYRDEARSQMLLSVFRGEVCIMNVMHMGIFHISSMEYSMYKTNFITCILSQISSAEVFGEYAEYCVEY